MKRDVGVLLEDILLSIGKIEEYTDELSEDDFYDNSQAQDAVIRRLEIIGEAVKSIPADYKEKNQDIPWKNIAGMRDILTHQYFGVNLDRVWIVIKKDMPELKANLSKLEKDY